MDSAINILEHFFTAINRNDMSSVTRHFDPDIERIEPEGYATAGTYRGIEAVREHITTGRGTWAEGACTPERFLVNGEKIVVYLVARVRLKESTEWIGGQFADGFVFRNGRIVQYRTFWKRAEALDWAGLEDREAT